MGAGQQFRRAGVGGPPVACLLDVNVRAGDFLELQQRAYDLRDIAGAGRVVRVNAGYVLESEQVPVSVNGRPFQCRGDVPDQRVDNSLAFLGPRPMPLSLS